MQNIEGVFCNLLPVGEEWNFVQKKSLISINDIHLPQAFFEHFEKTHTKKTQVFEKTP